MIRISSIAVAAAIIVGGCTIKDLPDLKTTTKKSNPSVPVPSRWYGAANSYDLRSQSWVDTFHDPQLRQLVDEALQNNLDIHIAASRVEQASGYATIAGSSLLPSVDAIGRDSFKDTGGGSSTLNGWGVLASWEADLWGRARYEARAAESAFYSIQADQLYARHSIAALVAKGWFAAIEAHKQQQYLEGAIVQAQKIVELSQKRDLIGAGSEYEVLQAQGTVTTLQDQLGQVNYTLSNVLRSLEVLIGRYPRTSLAAYTHSAALKPIPPAGVPSELLERRPDIIASRYRLLSAYDLTNEARAARLPSIKLDASVSDFSSSMFVLQNSGISKSIGGSLAAPIFHGGALKAQEDVRTAEQKEAALQYKKVVLNAFYEVENTLSHNKNLLARERTLASLVDQSRKTLQLEEARYKIGSRDMRALADAQIKLIQAQMALLRVQSELRIQRVNLYLALGGNI